jgi:hypothetical protein
MFSRHCTQIENISGDAPDFNIQLEADAAALFVLLDQGDIPGYFSDNGFFFVPGINGTNNGAVQFHSKAPSISTVEEFAQAFALQGTIMSLGDRP